MISHSSAFQTISVKSVYRKIIKCSGSILVNLNKIMKTNRHATRMQREKTQKGLFLWWKDFYQSRFKICIFLLIQLVGTMFSISLFLEVLLFSYAPAMFEKGFK